MCKTLLISSAFCRQFSWHDKGEAPSLMTAALTTTTSTFVEISSWPTKLRPLFNHHEKIRRTPGSGGKCSYWRRLPLEPEVAAIFIEKRTHAGRQVERCEKLLVDAPPRDHVEGIAVDAYGVCRE